MVTIFTEIKTISHKGMFECLVKRVTVIVFCNVDRPITLLGVSCVELLSEFIVWGEKQKSQRRCSCFLRLQKKQDAVCKTSNVRREQANEFVRHDDNESKK